MSWLSGWKYCKYHIISPAAAAELASIFGIDFVSGIQDGHGANVWLDNMNKVNLEIDFLRIRNKIASRESELQPLRYSNGTLCISTSAKIKRIIT